jgi:hypothetical protein
MCAIFLKPFLSKALPASRERLPERQIKLFLDVRSCVEYKFVGHAVGSILVPWMDEPEWEVNPRFCHATSHPSYRVALRHPNALQSP